MDDKTKEEMMKFWIAAGTPGEAHRLLGRFNGTWGTVTRSWMEGPKGPESKSEGTATYRWLVPDLWQIGEFQGEFMGRPFQGFEIRGYDNLKKKHVGIWLDNSSSVLLRTEGNYDPAGQDLILFGEGGDGKMMRFVTRFLDGDRYLFEIYDLTTGVDGAKMMEMTCTRRRL